MKGLLGALALCLLLLTASPVLAQGNGVRTTIFLVRHAEKDTMKTDPPLTAVGRARAQLLARILKLSGVRSTHSTQYRRTVETVAPLDSSLGIANEVFSSSAESLASHVAALVAHLLSAHKGETTVVASHSNVLPMLLKALGVQTPVEIGDHDYDNLFVVTVGGGGKATLVRLQMGME
jgi:broad specificity phosphatase PhoE